MKKKREPLKNSKWSSLFNVSDDDILRIFLPMIDDEEQRRLEELEDDQDKVDYLNGENEE